MNKLSVLKAAMIGTALAAVFSARALADQYNIPGGDLVTALNAYSTQTGVEIIVSDEAIRGTRTNGARGDLTASAALSRILAGTGFVMQRDMSGAVGIVRAPKDAPQGERIADAAPIHMAAAAASVETVVVTSSKIKGDIQTVPIAITALSQEQLTSRQIAGGPDLVKEVPNLTFSKTNFTGYNIQIRGIGTQAISVTTDPAVAVALNDIPFIRNHFFEQEFFDVSQVEVLRGPQGTLYGRNATAGVVNVISAKPTDQFEAMLSADWGNYTNRRYEGMVNIPIVDDRFDLRIAGEWTKRDGYTTNENTGDPVDGRDLWSSRVTLQWKPSQGVQATLVWEHFGENDDRMRTAKQLCHTDPGLTSVDGERTLSNGGLDGLALAFGLNQGKFSQGCLPAGLYAPESFQVPNGYSLPYVEAGYVTGAMNSQVDPYASATQSRNLRVIETQINPRYIAKNDTLELNVDYSVTPAITFTSQTGYNNDFLWSTEDYNRFNTTPDIFLATVPAVTPDGNWACAGGTISIGGNQDCTGSGQDHPSGIFCDPQLGCSSRLVAQDISSEHAWQFSQEFRFASNFAGPLNFSVGGNYMHYETVEDYYVLANSLTLFAAEESIYLDPNGGGILKPGVPWTPGVTDNHECFQGSFQNGGAVGYQYNDPSKGAGIPTEVCYYIDPNPLGSLNGNGHNYFLSQNPYVLNSYAGFGEAYYQVVPDLKLTGGIRWTDDQKHFIDIPSELLANGYGYMSTGTVNQQWNQLTGRLAANWSPKLDFTDQTLIYGSYAHGYKAGGANPPGATLGIYTTGGGVLGVPVHPLTFKPEFIDAYELGTKNTLLDGGLTLNGDVFYYNYKGYQISRIVDRTSINDNFDATVKGAEVEAMYEPLPGLKFNFAGGYEDTRIDNGQSSVDLMDRTAGHPGWVVMKPFVTQASNCVLPDYVVAAILVQDADPGQGNPGVQACGLAYDGGLDPVTQGTYGASWPGADVPARNLVTGEPYYTIASFPFSTSYGYPLTISRSGYTTQVYPGFDPSTAPNGGAGFAKNLGGNQLPNAPRFTASLSGEYTIPVSEDWAATLHSDFYWQSQSFARVFNDRPYDKIRGYSTTNLALILTSASGWQVMGYLKNVFNVTAITGDFLNSDDSGLTTNVFLTDPRLFGVRVTKNW